MIVYVIVIKFNGNLDQRAGAFADPDDARDYLMRNHIFNEIADVVPLKVKEPKK